MQPFIGRVLVSVRFDPDLPLRKSGPDCGWAYPWSFGPVSGNIRAGFDGGV